MGKPSGGPRFPQRILNPDRRRDNIASGARGRETAQEHALISLLSDDDEDGNRPRVGRTKAATSNPRNLAPSVSRNKESNNVIILDSSDEEAGSDEEEVVEITREQSEQIVATKPKTAPAQPANDARIQPVADSPSGAALPETHDDVISIACSSDEEEDAGKQPAEDSFDFNDEQSVAIAEAARHDPQDEGFCNDSTDEEDVVNAQSAGAVASLPVSKEQSTAIPEKAIHNTQPQPFRNNFTDRANTHAASVNRAKKQLRVNMDGVDYLVPTWKVIKRSDRAKERQLSDEGWNAYASQLLCDLRHFVRKKLPEHRDEMIPVEGRNGNRLKGPEWVQPFYYKSHMTKDHASSFRQYIPEKLLMKDVPDPAIVFFTTHQPTLCETHHDRDCSALVVFSGKKYIFIKKKVDQPISQANHYFNHYPHAKPFDDIEGSLHDGWSLVTLDPGDALILPKQWVHAVLSAPRTVAISFQVKVDGNKQVTDLGDRGGSRSARDSVDQEELNRMKSFVQRSTSL